MKVKKTTKKTTTNGERHTNKIMDTVSHVATPLVVINRQENNSKFGLISLRSPFNVLHSVLVY